MNPETRLKNSIIRYLKNNFKEIFVWKTNDQFTSGIPDLFILYKGHHIWMELKTDKGVVSKIQEYTIDKINRCGGESYVVTNLEQVKDLMRFRDWMRKEFI